MPDPLKLDQHFHIERRLMPSDYRMPAMMASLDHYSISFIINGDRKTFTPNCIYTLHSGDVGILPPLIYHQSTSLSHKPYERILIKYTEEIAAPLIREVGRLAFDHLNAQYVLHFTPAIQDQIFILFSDMLKEYESDFPYKEFALQSMLQRLLLTVMRYQLPMDDSFILLDSNCKQILEAIDYIDNHYKEDPSLEEIAAHVFLSPAYFSKLFKKQVGSTYSTYLSRTKLQHAQLLLMQTDFSMSAIAEEVGFVNGNYLCDVFKKYIGISPSKFRNQLGNTQNKE